jgi:serine/threonine protein kinase
LGFARSLEQGDGRMLSRALAAQWRSRSGRTAVSATEVAKPSFLVEIVVSSGAEIERRLAEQGLAPEEIVLKYCWPRYAPPAGSGIRLIGKLESLSQQFDRLIAMHRVVQSAIPMPVGVVKSAEGEFVGYVLEYAEGDTLEALLGLGLLDEAERRLAIVEETLEKLHAKSIAHGDVNPSNVIAADDGRTLLIDPIPVPGSGARLQDELCVAEIRGRIDALRA